MGQAYFDYCTASTAYSLAIELRLPARAMLALEQDMLAAKAVYQQVAREDRHDHTYSI